MKIVTVNLNGIRSALKKGFFIWLAQRDFDVICVQETRFQLEADVHHREFYPAGYHCYYLDALKKGYSGVGVYSKIKPQNVVKKIDHEFFDDEGRYLQLDFGQLSIVSLYLPSGSSGEARQTIKFQCMHHYEKLLKKQCHDGRAYIICGDWNIAHQAIDLKNWRSNQRNSGFLPEERAWLDKVFHEYNFVDAFRVVNQKPDQYTWWSQRGCAYENNVGWRIDYQVVSPQIAPLVLSAEIYKQEKFSDHAPLVMMYDERIRELM